LGKKGCPTSDTILFDLADNRPEPYLRHDFLGQKRPGKYKGMMNNTISASYRNLICLLVVGTLALTIYGCSDPESSEPEVRSEPGRLVVYNSATAPPINDPRAEIWNWPVIGAIAVSDSMISDSSILVDTLRLRAVKAGGRLYIRAEWVEDRSVSGRTYSVWPNAIAHYIDIADSGDTIFDFWQPQKSFETDTTYDTLGAIVDIDTTLHDQDRLALFWDTGDNGGERADCRSMCHAVADTTPGGRRMYTTGGGHVDVWHWQAATTDPVLLAEDEYWGDTGRASDAVTQPIYESNYDSVVRQPRFMHQDSTKRYQPFLHVDQAVPFDSTLKWYSSDILPGYLLHDNASGSVTDVTAFSSFSRTFGIWVVLMTRSLTTGHADDIDLAAIPAGDSVMVTLAFMNNSNRPRLGSAPFYIIFP
jgi:hypothetical protein